MVLGRRVAPRALLGRRVAPRALLGWWVAPRALLERRVAPRALLGRRAAPRAQLGRMRALLGIVLLSVMRMWWHVMKLSCGDMLCGLFVDIARLAGVFARVADGSL